MSESHWQRSLAVGKSLGLLFIIAALVPAASFGDSVVGRNANVSGPTPPGYYRGLPHYQDNEPHCDKNSELPSNIICIANGYQGADHDIGDAWPRLMESQDNGRTWNSRFLKGSAADPSSDLGLGFGADPITVCFPGGCAGFFIASIRAEGGGTGGGVYMALLPEVNSEVGFRHVDEAGPPRTVQLGTGDNFLDKIDAIFVPDTDNPGIIDIPLTIETSPGVTEAVTRQWIKGRFIVVFASINSSNQNVRVYSTFSDDYGLNWSPPKQVANTTGVDTGVAVSAIGDNVFYAYRQFQDDSGGQVDAIWGALSINRGQTVKNPSVIVDNWCAFDQPTLPSSEELAIVASRTNNFVDLTHDGSNFIMVLAGRLRNPLDQSCLTTPFDYPAGSRVYVTKAGSNGKNWSTPVQIAPRDASDGPRDGHSFQFMPAVSCVLGKCLAIWYDSIRDSIRNLSYVENRPAEFGGPWTSAANAFEQFPLFGDFIHQLTEAEGGQLIQFNRTADIYARQFRVIGNKFDFETNDPQDPPLDPEPVRVTQFQRALLPSGVVAEVEQLPFSLKQYKDNKVSFMGDYVGIAVDLLRGGPDPADPTAPPVYEPNNGPDPANPQLKPSWFAYWTDTRNVRGQLYNEEIADADGNVTKLPFEKTPAGGGGMGMGSVSDDADAEVEERLLAEKVKLGAEGVEDTGPLDPPAMDCSPNPGQVNAPGAPLNALDNRNRIKDADIHGAVVKEPATAWVLNASKGLGGVVPDPNNPSTQIPLQRVYTIVARHENKVSGTKFRFRIMNQPVGWDLDGLDDARASWLQLPFKDFDNQDEGPPSQVPVEEVDEIVGPQSSVTVALFVVSAQAVNPVNVNVYEVDSSDNETLVETLTVDGSLIAGDLITPFGAPADVNLEEIHDPFVYEPTTTSWDLETFTPDVWNPDVWNPDVWNPDVWNPDVWNPDVWNPDVWNPDVWNPDVWNPDVWNVSLTDASTLDNPEIPSPDVSNIAGDIDPVTMDELYAKFDVQLTAVNIGNTTTPYVADFAANSSIVRQALANGDATAQIIVWQDFDLQSYQGCDEDLIVDPSNPDAFEATSAGQNRILAVADVADLLTLKIPTIDNNRFGSVTYWAESFDDIHFTVRFIASTATINTLAPELAMPGSISYAVSSQAANTGDFEINAGIELVIFDNIPPDLTVNLPVPVLLSATTNAQGDVGAVLPLNLVTASKEGEPNPAVTCFDTDDPMNPLTLGLFAPLGLGESTLLCEALSVQNNVTGSIEFAVIVEDNDPPILGALPADFTVERELVDGTNLSQSLQAAADAYDGAEDLPTATDDIDSDVTVTCSPVAPGGVVPFGAPGPTQTTITCTASDDGGNQDSDSFSITVADTTPPELTIPVSASGAATDPNGVSVTFNPLPSATDVGSVDVVCTAFDPEVEVTSGDLFPIGTTTVSCTATDDANNPTIGMFDVVVSDNVIIGSGLLSNKNSVKAGSVAGFTWSWVNTSGDPIDVGEGNQKIEAMLCTGPPNDICAMLGDDVLNEDPGSSDIRRFESTGWQFNWQTVDDVLEPLAAGTYLVRVTLLTTSPMQTQETTIRVRP